ncbi:MAG: histidinol dehydrogenase [Clostridia bacterium]|nr:histidinol dehydrogenase [Clostridia bacterium]
MIRILDSALLPVSEILRRENAVSNVTGAVASILSEVRERGDEAVREFTERFDRTKLDSFELTPEEYAEGAAKADPELVAVMEKAAENIRDYHSRQVRTGYVSKQTDGIMLGQRVSGLARVLLYVPGGTARYPSTVLMNAIPASLAKVGEIIMTTPPSADGTVPPAILAAAKIAGVHRVFKLGGAQAVAAFAYGTESVPRVDKIVGPGNAYVAEAKRQVYGTVAIDMIAGPSEILVVSDGKNEPRVLAADLLSQAEHDKNATAVLVTVSRAEAEAVSAELERQIPLLPRAEIARASVDVNGKIIIVPDVETAIGISNALAPEHLELAVEDPFPLLNEVRDAGSVFLGRNCPEPLGDYFAGTNHTLPTGGTARFSSPLSVDDFYKKTSFTFYSPEALDAVCGDVAYFARAEGLEAHARSALSRRNENE